MAEAIFVLAGAPIRQRGPIAALLSAAGWAAAAQRVLGEAWIATPDGVLTPADARRSGSASHLTSAGRPRWPRYVPVTAKIAAKDMLQWRSARRTHIDRDGPWDGSEVAFVWQRHDLFHTEGIELAQELATPSVLFVTAPQVWEARAWGVKRPGWERLLESRGDRPALQQADLLACGTEVVAEQVVRLGASADRVLVTPTGVDLDVFDDQTDATSLRTELGLDGRFVIGWQGSFRRFHAIEIAIEAVAQVENATLLLIGDGPERPAIEAMAQSKGVSAVFTGTVPHHHLPRYLAAMDAAILTASASASYHYSPLKLGEYLAAGRAVVAPEVGQIAERLTDGVDAVLYAAGDSESLAVALRKLRDDDDLRSRLGTAARATAVRSWSWDCQIERIMSAL